MDRGGAAWRGRLQGDDALAGGAGRRTRYRLHRPDRAGPLRLLARPAHCDVRLLSGGLRGGVCLTRLGGLAQRASVPVLTFVSYRGNLFTNVRTKGTLATI